MFIGIDLHKQYSYVTSMNENGTILSQKRIEHDPESLDAFIQYLSENDSIAVEATCNWYYIYELLEKELLEKELLEKRVSDISLAHPLKTRIIAEARIKTDKIDSEKLAHLL